MKLNVKILPYARPLPSPRAARPQPDAVRPYNRRLRLAVLLTIAVSTTPGRLIGQPTAIPGVLAGPSSESPEAASPADQAPRVEVSLHAATAMLTPGQPLWFGVRLSIEPGWHVYWRNPGDAGMATSLRPIAPEGWRWSEIRWPAPQRFRDNAGLLAYGYENQVVLLIALTPPDDIESLPLAEAPATFTVQWLACRDRCVLGEATLDVAALAAGQHGATLGSEADAQLIQQWRQRVPRDVNADPLVRDVRSQTLETSGALTQRVLVVATVDWADDVSDAAWYPDLLPDAEVVDVVTTTTGRETRIEAAVTGLPQRFRGYKVLPGVLVYRVPDGRERAVELAIEMNTADAASDLPTDDEQP